MEDFSAADPRARACMLKIWPIINIHTTLAESFKAEPSRTFLPGSTRFFSLESMPRQMPTWPIVPSVSSASKNTTSPGDGLPKLAGFLNVAAMTLTSTLVVIQSNHLTHRSHNGWI